jgi:type VI protein secretion system component VasK
LRWLLRVALVALLLYGAYWFSVLIGAKVDTPVPVIGKQIGHYWLPTLVFSLILLGWLFWLLWKLWAPDEEASSFPDIDQAWDEAVDALHQAGIEMGDLPLYLVLGQPASTEQALFNAAQLQLKVNGAPNRPEAPLHVYAHRDGRHDSLFVTCAGASLLGKQAAILSGVGDLGFDITGQGSQEEGLAPNDDLDIYKSLGAEQLKSLRSTGPAQEAAAMLEQARREGRSKLSGREIRAIRIKAGLRVPQLHGDREEIELQAARLKHLCRLIVRDRGPYCPINGILWLVPLAAADSEEDSNHTAAFCKQDLATARGVLQVHCPAYALVCDLETVTGFREFLEEFVKSGKGKLQQRMGQRFPLLPDLDQTTKWPEVLERGVQWICQVFLPTSVYKLFRVETPGRDELGDVIRSNARLYLFLSQLRERQKRLSRILTNGIAADTGEPALFGGCYLAGTGRDTKEQAFVAGVFRKLMENEGNYVTWTPEAIYEEANYNRWKQVGYVALAIFVLMALGLGAWRFWGP